MTSTPLDAPASFVPADDERLAGQWMESYWAQAAPWAKRFAFAIWAYYGWVIYLQFSAYGSIPIAHKEALGIHLGVILMYSPVALLGYFCFCFGQDLERALAGQDQLLLEKAFRQLHRFLLLGLVIAAIWVVLSFFQWYNIIQIMGQYNSSDGIYEELLQSE